MPTNRVGCTKVISHEKKLILIGGVDEKQKPIAVVDCFDTERETWEQLSPLPKGVTGPFITKVDEKIYCLGGTDKVDANQACVFDLDRNEWKDLPPMKYRRYACGGYVYGKKIYIVGGRDVKDPVLYTEAFDMETQQWEQLAKMDSVRVFYNVIGHNDHIYVFGGVIPMVGMSKVVEKYSIKENKWTRLKDLNTPRSDCAIGVVGERIILCAGLGLEGPLNTAITPHSSGEGWERIPSMKTSRASTTCFEFDGKLAVIGGVGQGGPQKVVEVLSVKQK